jgi:hypothetical protein
VEKKTNKEDYNYKIKLHKKKSKEGGRKNYKSEMEWIEKMQKEKE